MPRGTRKKRLLNPLKSQLLFAEQPRIGAKHEYGPQLRSAINPRSFVSEPSHQDLPVTTWVSPQFTSFEVKNIRRAGRGTKNLFSTSTLNTTSLSILPHARKTTVCKYPSLLFKTSSSVPHRGLLERRAASSIGDSQVIRHPQGDSTSTSTVSRNIHNVVSSKISGKTPLNTKEQQVSNVTVTPSRIGFEGEKQNMLDSVHASTSKGSYTPDNTSLLPPPHIETPEIPHSDQLPSSSIHSILFSPNQPKTPPRTINILVKDTPERDYGLKVTWRRRKKMMNLLKERGQLLVSEAIINNQWS